MNREILVRIAPTWEPDMPLIRWMRSHIQYITIPFALALFLLAWLFFGMRLPLLLPYGKKNLETRFQFLHDVEQVTRATVGGALDIVRASAVPVDLLRD